MVMSPLFATLLSIAMLGVFALGWGGVLLLRRGERQKGVLMLVAGFVVLMNVLIWTV